MGYSVGYDGNWGRDVGYGVPAICDHPDCSEQIDRGLAYVCCRQQIFGGDDGCGLYFCESHRWFDDLGRCERCAGGQVPFEPKPDVAEWVQHKLTDESWAAWRADHPEWVAVATAGGPR